jgi:hypothetical protein
MVLQTSGIAPIDQPLPYRKRSIADGGGFIEPTANSDLLN